MNGNYEEEFVLSRSAKNQKVIQFLIGKYGANLTLQEILEKYKEEEGEDLDRTYYDTAIYGNYDYENRPLKITDIQYKLEATQDEVIEIIKNMKQTNNSAIVFVPYYEENGLDPDYYEGLIKTEFLTRHILDHDMQYDAIKWRYEDGVFHFSIFKNEILNFVSYFNRRLNLTFPDEVID